MEHPRQSYSLRLQNAPHGVDINDRTPLHGRCPALKTTMSDAPKFTDAEVLARLEKADALLSDALEQIEQTQRLAALGTMMAGLAHELNNQLTPAMAYAELAKSNPRDSELHDRALDKILRSIRSAIKISDSVLGFAADGDSTNETCDVSDTVSSVLDGLVQRKAGQVRFETDVQPGTLVAIPDVQLQQVLLNLVLNAVKAMEGRGGAIRINAIPQADGRARITVEDTGPGIPAAIAATIFEPFVTAPTTGESTSDNDDSGAAKGTGLGLSICKQVLDRYQGRISVRSTPGEGATFTILLPLSSTKHAEAG